MNIILLQDDANIREKLSFVLDSHFNALVHEAADVEAARAILAEKAGLTDLFVADCKPEARQEAEKLRAENPGIHAIFYGPQTVPPSQTSPESGVTQVIDRGDIVQNLIQAIDALVQQQKLPGPNDDRNFCRIRTKLLLSVCPLESDIYIRLSESKYLKLFRQGDTFDLEDMEKYTVKKGVEFLFIRKNNTQDFIRKYQEELASYLKQNPAMSMEEVAEVNESVYETVQSLSGTLGFTKEVQDMAKTQVQLAVKAMGRSPKLSRVLDKLDSYKGKYIAAHSTMCGYLACAIASEMQWGSEATFHKLSLASFLHDIALNNHDLAACNTLDDVKNGGFTEAESKAFKQHPLAGAQIAKQFSEVPPDVDVIIAQHHERPDSAGFPRGLSPLYIAPLSAVFIVAHDMTQYALKKGKDFKAKDFLDESREKYKPSQFRKVLTAIEQLD